MNDDERKAYARHQIKEAVSHVDYLGLFESYPEYVGAPEDEIADLSDDDGRAVHDLIQSASIDVSWPNAGTGWWAEQDGEIKWCPTFQIRGAGCVSLPIWFDSEAECLEFIRTDLLGARELPEEK